MLLASAWLLLLLASCTVDDPPSMGVRMQAIDTRVCPGAKDLDQVRRVIARTPLDSEDFNCVVDFTCPCGSFCYVGFCSADCVTATDDEYGCSIAGDVCDNSGKCTAPAAPPANEVFSLSASPAFVDVVSPPTGTDFGEAIVRVTLSADATPPTAPVVIHVAGAPTLKATCPPGAPNCVNPHEEQVVELEVKCHPGDDYSDRCDLDSWIFTPVDPAHAEGNKHAVREVRVRPRRGATTSVWELRLRGEGDVVADQRVSLQRRSGARPLEGRYSGRLVVSRRGAPVIITDPETRVDAGVTNGEAAPADMAIPVTAFVRNDQILVVDPARVLTPSGKLRLGLPGTTANLMWLSDANGAVVGRVFAGTRDHDAGTGHVRARFSIALPVHDGDDSVALDGALDLDRLGSVDAPLCGTGNACPSAYSCDAALGLCTPGPAFTTTTVEPSNSLSFPALDLWVAAVKPQLLPLGLVATGDPLGGDAMERLQCYRTPAETTNWDARKEVLGAQVMATTGDQKCAGDGFVFPRGLPLLNKIDARRGNPVGESVSTLLAACMTELVKAPSATFSNDTCISLARVLPAMGLALEHGPDRRVSALLQHLVRGWVTVAAFSAQQLVESVTLSNADPLVPNVNGPALLDAFDAVWALVMDGTLVNALETLPPHLLASPDYRGTNRPRMYWSDLGAPDREGARVLSVPADCAVQGKCNMVATTVDPASVDLSRDLSVATEMIHVLGWNEVRQLVTSPWIRVSAETVNGIRDKDVRWTGAVPETGTRNDWVECRRYARSQAVLGRQWWSYDPVNRKCYRASSGFQDPGVEVYAAGWLSGMITPYEVGPGGHDTFRDNVIKTTLIPTNKKTLRDVATAQDCLDKCLADTTCEFFSFRLGSWPAQTPPVAPYCELMKGPEGPDEIWPNGQINLPVAASGRAPFTRVTVSHLTGTNELASTTFRVNRGAMPAVRRLVVSRSADAGGYRLWADGELQEAIETSPLVGQMPRRGIPAPLWFDNRFQRQVAVFDTAIDGIEANAIVLRASTTSNGAAYVTRPKPVMPETQQNHTQGTELATTLVEAVVPQLRLLSSYLETAQGAYYAECLKGTSFTVREPVQQRIGKSLRSAMWVEQLSTRLHDRARQIECDTDAACAVVSPTATCGPGRRIVRDVTTSPRSGKMRICTGTWTGDGQPAEQGICVPRAGDPSANGGLGGNGSGSPGTVGTAQIAINVPVTGTYRLWGRVTAQTDAHSLWLRIDGGTWEAWEMSIGTGYEWMWSRAPGELRVLSAGTHNVTIGVRDDGTVLRELVLVSETAAPPDALDQVCYNAGAPIVRVPVGDAELAVERRWRSALMNLDAAMQATAVRAARMGTCKNPLGIEESDLPLYFEPFTSSNAPFASLYFAASLFLNRVAQKAVDDAKHAYDGVHSDWSELQNQTFQRLTEGTNNQTRLDAIAARYSDQLEELCGTSDAADGGLLAKIRAGDLDPATCFVKPPVVGGPPAPNCRANMDRPVTEAIAGCYRGSVGQAVLAMKGAAQAIEGARLNWQSKQDMFENQHKQCAELQNTELIIQSHIDVMNALRAKKAVFDKVAGFVSLASSLTTGAISLNVADNMLGMVGWHRYDANGRQVGDYTWMDAASPAGQFLSIASGATSLIGQLTVGAEIADEQTKFQNELALRDTDLKIMTCFAAADRLHDEIGLAAIAIQTQITEFESAAMNFANRRVRIEQLAAEGNAELERESERTVSLPYHHYWLDQDVQTYQVAFTWAKRAVYLYMRAAEYDKQMSFGLRGAILDARDIPQLTALFNQITNNYMTDGKIGSSSVPPNGRVAPLSLKKVMGVMPTDDNTVGSFLSSPASYIYDEDGTLLGRGYRFQLYPDSPLLAGIDAPTDCGEHITELTGSVQLKGGTTDLVAFELWQSNTFASQKCGLLPGQSRASLVTSSHHPAHNLFHDESDVLFEQVTRTGVKVTNNANQSFAQLSNPLVSASDLMGRGLYGEYILFIREGVLTPEKLADVTDILFRIQYTAGRNGTAPGP